MIGVRRFLLIALFCFCPFYSFAYPVFNIASNARVADQSVEAANSIIESVKSIMLTFHLAEQGEFDGAAKTLYAVRDNVEKANEIIKKIIGENTSFAGVDLSRLDESEYAYMRDFLEKRGVSIDEVSDVGIVNIYQDHIQDILNLVESAIKVNENSNENGKSVEYDSFAIAIGPMIGDAIAAGGCITKLLNSGT